MEIGVVLLVNSRATLLQERSRFETEHWHSAVDKGRPNDFLRSI